MRVMVRRIFLLLIAVLSLVACGGREKQWYKPNQNYTVAEFQRDEAACTKDGVLDEECLKQRGWIAISADRDKPPPVPAQSPKGGSRPTH